MTVVLWDVDGTLVKAGPAGRLAFADAVADVLGLEVPPEQLPRMAGKTDPQIALELLDQLGVPDPRRHLGALEAALARALTARVHQIRTEGVVLPGVREALAALATAGAAQTVVTGNVAPNARTKLAAVGLGGGPLRLEIGAYGSDDGDRDNLVPIALERCRAAGLSVAPAATWVIGDTPRDLACARAAGVRCLLVATGGYEREVLDAAGADAVFADLLDTERVCELLTD
jgi:phosphoglycolate phosphatase-like HAD superfamily hydrolase